VTLDLILEGFPILSVVQPHNRTLTVSKFIDRATAKRGQYILVVF